MRVLTAPKTEDPRDGGYNHAHPGEILTKGFICDTGLAEACDCGEVFTGISSQRSTTVALVEDRDLTLDDYRAIIREDGEESDELADWLADLAGHYEPGSLIVTWIEDGRVVTDLLTEALDE